jgi:hypothetical protein
MNKLAILPLLLLAACGYSNPHGGQELEPVTRFTTRPAGAQVHIPRLNLMLESPCDLPYEVDTDDEIVVTMPGYVSWRGMLGSVPQVSLGTYELVLAKR